MDQEGFLPIGLIASFHRVQALTTNIALIVEVSTFFFLPWREIPALFFLFIMYFQKYFLASANTKKVTAAAFMLRCDVFLFFFFPLLGFEGQ